MAIAKNYIRHPEALAVQMILDLGEVFQLLMDTPPKIVRQVFELARRRALAERAKPVPVKPTTKPEAKPEAKPTLLQRIKGFFVSVWKRFF